MEEHAKELERDLREKIDLLESHLREVRIFISQSIFRFHFFRKNDKWNNFNTPSEIMNEQY